MKLLIALTLLAGIALATDKPKSLYKVFRFSPTSVGITCTSGELPEISPRAGRVEDGLVIVSCK